MRSRFDSGTPPDAVFDLMYADAGIIDISDTWDGNIVLIDEGNYRTMTFQQVPAQDHVGDVVCHAGSSTMEAVGYSICGTLTDRDLDYTSGGLRRLNVRGSNVNARQGDSGASVYNGHSALGIVAAGAGCDSNLICTDMIYSHIYYAVTMPRGTYGVQLTP